MYIPTWLIVVVAVIAFIIYRSKRKIGETVPLEHLENVEEIEVGASFLKERIFELEHFDSPHFIDCQNAFDVMNVNYLRLKQRLSHTPEKVLELAKDWRKYVEALGDLKHERVMLDLDSGDGTYDRFGENTKEPLIIKDEIEKKFKSLLGGDWQKIPLNYFERMETMEKPEMEIPEIRNEWKFYYQDCANLYNSEEKRKKEKEEREAEKK